MLTCFTARAQKPLLYLSISNPTGPLLNSPLPDTAPIAAIFKQRLQTNGYRVVTQPDTLRLLLAEQATPSFLYADVVCYHQAGGFPTVVFGVRDTLNVPWFTLSKPARLYMGQLSGFSSAANYLASQLPATFTPRFAKDPALPANRAPQFMVYDNFQFPTYLDGVLYIKSLRQQLRQGAELELAIQVDELGIATLQEVGAQMSLDAPTRHLLEAAIRNTPPWAPAFQNDRRVTSTVRIKRQPLSR